MKLSFKAQILIAVPLCFEIAFVSALIHTQNQLNRSFEQQSKMNETLSAVSGILKAMPQALFQSGLYQFSHNQRFSKEYQRSVDDIRGGITKLKALEVGDSNPLLTELDHSIDLALDKMQTTHVSFKSENQYMIMANLLMYKGYVDNVIRAADKLSAEQRNKIDTLKSYEEKLRNDMAMISSFGVLVSILLSLAMAVSFQNLLAKKIAVLNDNGFRLAAGQPLLPALAGDDELTQLDSNFHDMANALAYLRSKELAVVENAVEIICSLDKVGKFKQVNSAVLEILQLMPEDLVGKPLSSISVMNDNALKSLLSSVAAANRAIPIEVPCYRKDRKVRDLQWSMTWNQEELTFFCVAHDITERNKVDQLKRDMIAMVSHDLRSPLTSLQAYFELLGAGRFGSLSPEGNQKVFQAEGIIRRLKLKINALLDIEKLESGNIELNRQPQSLAEMLQHAAESIQSLAEKKQIELRLDPTDGTTIYCDQERITDVLINLLHNAVKFSPKASKIEVKVTDNHDTVAISVSDNGKGVP